MKSTNPAIIILALAIIILALNADVRAAECPDCCKLMSYTELSTKYRVGGELDKNMTYCTIMDERGVGWTIPAKDGVCNEALMVSNTMESTRVMGKKKK